MKRIFSLLFLFFITTLSLAAYTVDDIPDGYFSTHGSMCDSCTNDRTDVRYLQVLLNADDRLSVSLVEDGYWGSNTKNAVIAFQSEYGLSPVDGWVGSGTKSKLDEVLTRVKTDDPTTNEPYITDISPNNLNVTSMQYVELYGDDFGSNCQVYWKTSSGNNGIINDSYVVFRNSEYIKFKLYGVNSNSTYWKFKVVNADGKESTWIRADVQSDGSNGGVSETTNFLHFPLSGGHTAIGISSIFDHDSSSKVVAFDGQTGESKYGKRTSTSKCYETKTDSQITFPGLKYVGTSEQNKYLCYDGHHGFDYSVPIGTDVLAAANGVVVSRADAGDKGGYYLIVNHGNGYATGYMHLQNSGRLAVGTKVTQGQRIAYSGNSGGVSAHLHFEVRSNYTTNITQNDDTFTRVDPYTTNKNTDLWADWGYDGIEKNEIEQCKEIYIKNEYAFISPQEVCNFNPTQKQMYQAYLFFAMQDINYQLNYLSHQLTENTDNYQVKKEVISDIQMNIEVSIDTLNALEDEKYKDIVKDSLQKSVEEFINNTDERIGKVVDTTVYTKESIDSIRACARNIASNECVAGSLNITSGAIFNVADLFNLIALTVGINSNIDKINSFYIAQAYLNKSVRAGYFDPIDNTLVDDIAKERNIDTGNWYLLYLNRDFNKALAIELMKRYRNAIQLTKNKYSTIFPPKKNNEENEENHRPTIPSLTIIGGVTNVPLEPILEASESSYYDSDGDSHKYTWWGIREHETKKYIFDTPYLTVNKNRISIKNSPYLKSGLKPNTQYDAVVAFADSKGLFSYGKFVTFTTEAPPIPIIEVSEATNITQNGADIWRYYDRFGVENTRTNIEWGETTSLGEDASWHTVGTNELGVSYRFEELECGTTYYYRANISNEIGESQSDIKHFTTLPCGAKASINSQGDKNNVAEYNDVEIGSCITQTITVTKENDQGTASGSVEILQGDESAFSLKGSSTFELNGDGDKKTFEVEFCPTEKKVYVAMIEAKASDTSFVSNRTAVTLVGSGAEDTVQSFSGDFYLSDASLDKSTVKAGEQLTASVTQQYSGERDEEQKVYVGYYLSKDKYWDPDSDDRLERDSSYLSSGNRSEDERERLTIPVDTPAGDYYILFVTDYKKQYDEDSENNNVEYMQIRITNENILIDTDGDGYADDEDAFPNDPNEWLDTDGDGTGNNADSDDDNDGISDTDELTNGLNPLDDSDAKADSDGDGVSNKDEIAAGTDPQDGTDAPVTYSSKEYNTTSYYVAYDPDDTSQYALVMPSIQKIYTHKAGDITHLHRVDSDFSAFAEYDHGNLCFPALNNSSTGAYGASTMAGECYEVKFFYTQKERTDDGTAFMLYYKPAERLYEGLAGKAETFKVVKDGSTIQNSNSLTHEDYTNFRFDINTAAVKIRNRCENVDPVSGACED